MATTDQLTGARVGDMDDGPYGGLFLGRVVKELSVWTNPAFDSAAARDAAYQSRVVEGTIVMRNGLHCTLNGWQQTYSNGAWRYSEGVVNVPDRTARDQLAGRAYSGLVVHQIDRDLTLRWVDGGWHPIGSYELYSNNMGAQNGISNTRWDGYVGKDGAVDGYGWFEGDGRTRGLGTKIRIPAQGVSMNVTINGLISCNRDGFMRLCVNIINGPVAQLRTNGVRHSNPNAEGVLYNSTIYNHTGLHDAEIFMEVMSGDRNNLADFFFPKTWVTCSPIQ